MIEHVPHKRWPAPSLSNTDRWRAWQHKRIDQSEPQGNGFFNFGPRPFDPPGDWPDYNNPSTTRGS